MPKLHEVLAVESELEGKFKFVSKNTKDTFANKPAHFMGGHRKLTMFADDGVNYPEEHQEVSMTVDDCLADSTEATINYFNAICRKERTNQVAKASIEIGGEKITGDLPATFLLGLESRLKVVRGIYDSIPTLASNIKWDKDEAKGDNIFAMAMPEENMKTARAFKSQVLYEATDKHPAQIEKWEETVNVGKFTKNVFSGMITPSRKRAMLNRIDTLITAVKQARQRANSAEVERCGDIGGILMGFINEG